MKMTSIENSALPFIAKVLQRSGIGEEGPEAHSSRGPQPPGHGLVLYHGLLETRLHSRR